MGGEDTVYNMTLRTPGRKTCSTRMRVYTCIADAIAPSQTPCITRGGER